MIRILMNGLGKMGRVICELAEHSQDFTISAGVDINEAHSVMPFPTFTDIFKCEMPADVIIDFSNVASLSAVLEYAMKIKRPIVICTTGYTEEDVRKIHEAAKTIPVFFSANMSLGINLLNSILSKISSTLYDSGFDIEIIEKHHNQKLDAPSGTALLLANTINASLDNTLQLVNDRSQVREKRKREELGISALRGGTIVGEHSVLFAGKDEVIEFKHSALSKELFAVGALRAAGFMKGKTPGLYTMANICDEIIG